MAGNGDMKAHTETYGLVMNLLKWGTVGAALVGILVILIIAR
jgi:Bacterial aa3 type cytochrome c oxidase subunit IV